MSTHHYPLSNVLELQTNTALIPDKYTCNDAQITMVMSQLIIFRAKVNQITINDTLTNRRITRVSILSSKSLATRE